MNAPDIAARNEAWSTYWAAGPLHSCLGTYAGNYDGDIGAFWRTLFADLPADAHVLDLATGNGPLVSLLLDVHGLDASKTPRIDGVDMARHAAVWVEDLAPELRARVTMESGVNMESLPFDDARYDCIVSQYGFEYSDRTKTVSEIARVAKARATVAMICHHAGSRLVDVANEEVAHIGWLLDESGFVDAARTLLPYIARSGTPEGVAELRDDESANAARARFNAVVDEIADRAQDAEVPDSLQVVQENLPGLMQYTVQNGAEAGSQAFESWINMMRNALLRSRELVSFALDDAARGGVVRAMEGAGFVVETGEVHEGGHLMGWTLKASRG